MEIQELLRAYYDTATIPLTLKGEEGFSDESVTVAHRPIDKGLWDELEAMRADESDETPLNVRQLVRLDAHIKDLTDGGSPVAFTAEFWRDLNARQPSLVERIVEAVAGNVPDSINLLVALRALAEGEGAAKGDEGSTHAEAQPATTSGTGEGGGESAQPADG